MKRIGVIAILVLAFCGLANAAYLTEHVVNGTGVICSVEGLVDCNTVIASQQSRILGVPVAELGVFFYAIVFIFAALELWLDNRFLRRVIQGAGLVGVIASLYFTALQAFVLHAFCLYCLTSALITLLILVCAGMIEPVIFKKRDTPLSLPPPNPRQYLSMPPVP